MFTVSYILLAHIGWKAHRSQYHVAWTSWRPGASAGQNNGQSWSASACSVPTGLQSWILTGIMSGHWCRWAIMTQSHWLWIGSESAGVWEYNGAWAYMEECSNGLGIWVMIKGVLSIEILYIPAVIQNRECCKCGAAIKGWNTQPRWYAMVNRGHIRVSECEWFGCKTWASRYVVDNRYQQWWLLLYSE